MTRVDSLTIALAVALLQFSQCYAGENSIAESDWHGFSRLNFKVDGRDCILVEPQNAAAGNPWIWRTEYFDHEPQVDLALARRGYHIAYMDVQDMYGSPTALDHLDKFYDYLIVHHKLNAKPVLEGFSRGAIYALNWAARRPNCVAAIYNDAPVCDVRSWPGGYGRGPGSKSDWAAMLKAYEIEEEPPKVSPHNPIDNLAPLAKARIPLLHVCGSADEVVPMEENTSLLAKRYKRLGGHIEVIEKPGVGHHPHSLKDPAPIVEFIVRSSETP